MKNIENMINRRKFFRRGLVGGVMLMLPRTLWASLWTTPSARLKVKRVGANVVITAEYSPTESVWELQKSLNTGVSWTIVQGGIITAPGKMEWTITATQGAVTFRLRQVTATLVVEEKSYQIPVGQILFDALGNLKASATTSFTFKSTDETQNEGQFVTSLNERNSKYWVFEPNDQPQSDAGVLDFTIPRGTIIWLTTQ